MEAGSVGDDHPVLSGLNAQQREVAEHRGSPLLVFAAAGTGKTQALTSRIAHLVLRDGVAPSRVLALTFTRKAAGEMRRRAAALCGVEQADLRNVCTFHSLCVRLLRMPWHGLGSGSGHRRRIGRDFTILDPAQAEAILDACLPAALDAAWRDREASGASGRDASDASDASGADNARNRIKDATSASAVMRAIDAWRNRGLEPDDAEVLVEAGAQDGWPLQAVAAHAYASYRDACAHRNVVDFSDLLLHACAMLSRSPPALERCRRELFEHLLVDEFQDTNPAQMRLVVLLCKGKGGCSPLDPPSEDPLDTQEGGSRGAEPPSPSLLTGRNLMVVGDDYQAIHEWRGATVRNILGFADDWPGARVVCLSLNYRSVPSVLAAARLVIAGNSRQRHKELIATRVARAGAGGGGGGGEGEGAEEEAAVSVVFGAKGQWAEARAIASRIKARLGAPVGDGQGAKPSDFAILYRINAQSQPLEEALRDAGVPYRVRGSLAFFDRAEIKDAMSYARLLCNPRSDTDFERAIAAPHRGIGAATLDRLRSSAAALGGCLMDAAEAEVDAAAKPAKGKAKRHAALAEFVQLVRDLRQPPPFDVEDLDLDLDLDLDPGAPQGGGSKGGEPPFRECLARSGLLDALRDADARDSTDRLENVEALLALARRSEHSSGGLREFVDACAVSGPDVQHAAEAEVEAVALMTLHASKGLEFVDVTIAGCVEGWLPYQRSLQEGRLEEERRLCYVGITRARDRLVLSAPRSMTGFRGEVRTEPSRFIAEAFLSGGAGERRA